jgi:hypothetical protein
MMKHAIKLLVIFFICALMFTACGGGGGGSSSDGGVADSTPPTIPANLLASAASSSEINLSWSASTDAVGVAGYKVYRNGVYLKAVAAISTSDTGLIGNVQYCYKVSAYDAAGNHSAQSTEACAMTPTGGAADQMGGSIQGTPLTLLTPSVSTLASGGFNYPQGITTDRTNVYVADTANHIIKKIVISTGAVTTFAGTAGLAGSTDATGAAARFNLPNGIVTDGTNLYVADGLNHTIRKIVISTGAVTTFAGTAGLAGSTDATGAAARFNYPNGITTDRIYLYVADNGNHTIRKIVISTVAVTTFAGTAGLFGSDNGVGAVARFNYPNGITMDGTYLYVTDTGNHTIRKIVIANQEVTTLAGTAGLTGSTDATGADARFYESKGITTDGTNLYVADTRNHTIRKIVIANQEVTTLAGTAGLTGSTDAYGADARFNWPNGITTDGNSLYVADTNNNSIRQIQ